MKILYLAHRIPYPPNKGDKIRSFNEIKYLSNSYELHLACLADDPGDLRYEQDLKKYCENICIIRHKTAIAKIKGMGFAISNRPISVGFFYSRPLQSTVSRWLSLNKYRAVICFSSPMAEYIVNQSTSRLINESPELIMDFCDVDSDKWLQYSRQTRFPFSVIWGMENRLLLKYEKRINSLFDHSVFVSKQEADLFQRLYPRAKNVTVMPNGVDHEYFSPDRVYTREPIATPGASDKHKKLNKNVTCNPHPILLFTGAMDYYANVDGVTWFCNEVLPIIKRDFNELEFNIVGSNPDSEVRGLAKIPGVTVTGFVEDIRPYYQAADICVVPLRIARGIQNKILEAMSMRKPVVTTKKAIEGINAESEKHVLVEETPKGFAQAVSTLLKDHQCMDRIGADGQEFVKDNFNWTINMKKFEKLILSDR